MALFREQTRERVFDALERIVTDVLPFLHLHGLTPAQVGRAREGNYTLLYQNNVTIIKLNALPGRGGCPMRSACTAMASAAAGCARLRPAVVRAARAPAADTLLCLALGHDGRSLLHVPTA